MMISRVRNLFLSMLTCVTQLLMTGVRERLCLPLSDRCARVRVDGVRPMRTKNREQSLRS